MSKAFKSITQGLVEAVAHVAGKPSKAIVHKPQPVNVKAIRKQGGMTQTEFAASFGISISTLRHWERGDRTPRGPALVLLRVVAKAPRAVLNALETFGHSERGPVSETEDCLGPGEMNGMRFGDSTSPDTSLQQTPHPMRRG
jgi:putative transcriptional regulator